VLQTKVRKTGDLVYVDSAFVAQCNPQTVRNEKGFFNGGGADTDSFDKPFGHHVGSNRRQTRICKKSQKQKQKPCRHATISLLGGGGRLFEKEKPKSQTTNNQYVKNKKSAFQKLVGW
jgi:hypothetical protein